ncbi:diadenylate cyclase [Streptococcus rupicaprae]|uniref:Diadenylate cyclase n=1 Tax=Streptococcus rupicaprae TaxID=759619 RepID=A0ABV2FJ58_9STRE
MSFSQLWQNNGQFWQTLVDSPWRLLVNIVDIALVTAILYFFIKTLAGSRVVTLVRGVGLFILAQIIASIFGLQTISFLLSQIFTYGIIATVVIFAPEIRAALEKLGRTATVFSSSNSLTDEEKLIQAFVKATDYMAPRKIGALVSVEGTKPLAEFISTGISLDADISSELLINIFIPNTPLHDGAVIVKNNKIAAASAYLPLSDSSQISKEFGTRHRAAIGLSEQTDAFTFIVSEETGNISVTHQGVFKHDLSREEFKQELERVFGFEQSSSSRSARWFQFWKGGSK